MGQLDTGSRSRDDKHARLELVIGVILWYCGSVVANSTSRKILQQIPAPLHLSTVQFTIAIALSSATFGFMGRKPLPLESDAIASMHKLAVVYTIGFVFVNAGFVILNVSLAETLRAAEPLISVFMVMCFLKDEPVSNLTVASMIPIVSGGALSSLGDGTFTPVALVIVTISNVCFSTRSVYVKSLATQYQGTASDIFYHVSVTGLLGLLVTCIGIEVAAALGIGSSWGVKSIAIPIASGRVAKLLPMLILNGSTYWLYNQMSYFVLSRVEMVTHAVANAFRRVVTILFAIWYFQNQILFINGCGIFLAFSGVLMYAYSKHVPETKEQV